MVQKFCFLFAKANVQISWLSKSSSKGENFLSKKRQLIIIYIFHLKNNCKKKMF